MNQKNGYIWYLSLTNLLNTNKYISTLFFILTSFFLVAQEICDNGIDDDNNGLIDLQDDQCLCDTELPTSLIPNESFEERTCCPSMNAQLNCAVGWIQASNPTTDYVNICSNYLGNTSIPAFAPLPLADGEGAVGFRDGQSNVGPNYKEYVGACLLEPMEQGTPYRLQFFVGFRDNVFGSQNLDIAIFGSTDCSQLPFGNNSSQVGCPANTSFYDQIDVQSVSGNNEWVSVEFEFTPTKDYNVIILGPACATNPNYIHDPYFYLDGLTLAQSKEFGFPIQNVSGAICNDDLTLSVDNDENANYQWYLNGVALVGETSSTIVLTGTPDAEGEYLVVINPNGDCIRSGGFDVLVPPYYADFETSICDGETFSIESSEFTEDGFYDVLITASDGCDSIVTLDLEVIDNTDFALETDFCEGDLFEFFDISTDQAGFYETIIMNEAGCDSLINVDLTMLPQPEELSLDDEFVVELGCPITLTPMDIDPNIDVINWYNSNAELIGEGFSLEYNFVDDTEVTIELISVNGCVKYQMLQVILDKGNRQLFLPNIFSPNDDRVNDYFSIKPSKSLTALTEIRIFDRWGQLVFIKDNIPISDNMEIWDGYFNQLVRDGVYVYTMKANYVDGYEEMISGDVTIIK